MAKSVLQIVIETLKKGSGDKETQLALKKIQGGLASFGVAAGAATGIYLALDKTIGAGIRTQLQYAAEVRRVSQVTNESAESTSRTIQVVDDYKISVEDLLKAHKELASNGKSLSTETLAQLSDAFLELNDGTERQLFLSKELGGKTGQNFVGLMLAGGDAIRAQSAAITPALVLSQKQLDAARKLELQQDELNDQWQAMKVTLGSAVVPALTAVISRTQAANEAEEALIAEGLKPGTLEWLKRKRALTENILAQQELAVVSGNLSNSVQDYAAALRRANPAIDSATLSYIAMGRAAQIAGERVDAAGEGGVQTAEELSAANQELLGVTNSLQAETDRYNDALEENAAAQAEVVAALKLADEQGYQPAGRHMRELQGKLDDLKGAAADMAEAHQKAARQIVLSLLQQKMAADGLDARETEILLGLQEQWGFLDADTAAAARRILEVSNNLDGLDGREITARINLALTGAGVAMLSAGDVGQQTTTNPASGPTPYARGGKLGRVAIVGEEGYELVIDGVVIPHDLSQQILRGGMSGMRKFATGGPIEDSMINWPGGTAPADSTWNTGAAQTYGTISGGATTTTTRRRRSTSTNLAVSAAVSTASQAAAESSAAAAAVGQVVADQGAQAAELSTQGNQISQRILDAIQALPDRLAAKLAQGRL